MRLSAASIAGPERARIQRSAGILRASRRLSGILAPAWSQDSPLSAGWPMEDCRVRRVDTCVGSIFPAGKHVGTTTRASMSLLCLGCIWDLSCGGLFGMRDRAEVDGLVGGVESETGCRVFLVRLERSRHASLRDRCRPVYPERPCWYLRCPGTRWPPSSFSDDGSLLITTATNNLGSGYHADGVGRGHQVRLDRPACRGY